MKSRFRSALVLSAVLLVGSTYASPSTRAQEEDAAESRAATFRAVEGPQKEQVPGGPLVVYAYGFVLVSLVAYVARLGGLHAKNRAELERLARSLERGQKG